MEFLPLDDRFEGHLRDESRRTGIGEWIAFPTDTQALAEAVAAAWKQGGPLALQGARTGVAGGALPRGGYVVSTEKMTAIRRLRRTGGGPFRLWVEAGVTLDQVSEFLRRPMAQPGWDQESLALLEEMKQWGPLVFPPNPTEGSATLGGLFATNAKGPNSLARGSVGANCHAITWVTPMGEVWSLARGQYLFDQTGCGLPDGRRLDCPVGLEPWGWAGLCPAPGMDLVDFFAGSEGLLGCCAGLELELAPQPPECWGVVYFFRRESEALSFASALGEWHRAHPGGLSEAEYYSGPVLELLRREGGRISALGSVGSIPQDAAAALCAVVEGDNPEALETALLEHMELYQAAGGQEEDTWAAGSRRELEPFRALRHAVPELLNTMVDQIRRHYPGCVKTATDFAGPPQAVAAYWDMYRTGLAESGLIGYLFGHILENRLHCNFLPETEAQHRACRELICRWAGEVASRSRGLVAGENGVGRSKKPLLRDCLPPERKQQIARILGQLNPLRADWLEERGT